MIDTEVVGISEFDRDDLLAIRRLLDRLVETRPFWSARDEWTYQQLASREAILLGRFEMAQA